jgi:hypothetical protein
MTRLAIEINDAGLIVADRDAVLAVEPGYALVEGGKIATGAAAYAQARLKPRLASNDFWARLSVEEHGGTTGPAELAFAQLSDVWGKVEGRFAEVVLVVPARYKGQELGVLLGLAQETGVPVRAMVDVAVAASDRPYPGRQLLYVDAGLHRASVTPLEQSDEVRALVEHALEGTGLAGVHDALARRIAEIFVLATRFDPFHEAASEQLLYDRLPEWLERLSRSPSIEISIPFGGDEFAVELERGQLLGAVSGFFKALVQLIAQVREGSSGVVVQLSDRLARLPGITDAMQRIDDSIVVPLAHGHAARSVLEGVGKVVLDAEQIKLFRHLPWRAQAHAEAAPRAAEPFAPRGTDSRRAPTHVVYKGIGYPVNGGLVIGRSKTDARRAIIIDEPMGGVSRTHCELALVNGELRLRDLSSYGTYVNERRAAGELVLEPADVIRIGSPGAELYVVAVET